MSEQGMRVGIDGFNLALAEGTGVATYARSLASALHGMGRRIDLIYGIDVPAGGSPALRETLFFSKLAEGRTGNEPPDRLSSWGKVRRGFMTAAPRDLVEVPASGRVIRAGFGNSLPDHSRLFTLNRLFHLGSRYLKRFGRLLPIRMADPPAIMHWTYPVPVRLVGSHNVYTIHDLVPLRLPFLSLEDKAYHEHLLQQCIASAAHVLTVSEWSRAEILDCLPVAPEQVTNCYQAVEATIIPEPDLTRRLRALFGLEPQSYLLFSGAIEPKKNVGRLIQAYLEAELETPLIIAGPAAWGADKELELVEGRRGQLPGAARIRRIPYLPAEQLAILRAGARALLFPSLHEGFGLPAIEAMAAGVPVLASTAGALPEILGGAALLEDPYDLDALRAALVRMDGDAVLREILSQAGRRRAAEYSLARFQSRLSSLHRRLLGEASASPRDEISVSSAPFATGDCV